MTRRERLERYVEKLHRDLNAKDAKIAKLISKLNKAVR